VRNATETDSQKQSTDDYATAALELEQMREAVARKHGRNSIRLGIILLDLHECYEKLGDSEQADSTWRSITNTLRHAANHTRIRQRLEQVFFPADTGLQDH
jgi:hypothetical protein